MITLLKHTSEGTWEIDFNKLNLEGIEHPFYEICNGSNLQLYDKTETNNYLNDQNIKGGIENGH